MTGKGDLARRVLSRINVVKQGGAADAQDVPSRPEEKDRMTAENGMGFQRLATPEEMTMEESPGHVAAFRSVLGDSRGDAQLLWRELIDGRWSVVHRFDDGGRRHLVLKPAHVRSGAVTMRERQVLALTASGMGVTQVARRLGLSPSTVSHYRRRAMIKLGAGSHPELMRLFARADAHFDDEEALSGGL